jgi:hypothetical protein
MFRYLRFLATTIAVLTLLITAFAGAVPVSAAQGDATISITFVACPPGGDWSGPPAGCSEVIEAPENAMLTAAPDWVRPVRDLDRNADGSYTVSYAAANGAIGLVNFFSPNHNAFTFTGVDTITRWYGEVTPAAGETRDITVYYWNGPVDLIMPAENGLVVNAWQCGEGIDPAQDATGCEPVTGDIPSLYIGTSPLRGIRFEDYLTRDGGTFTYNGLPAYTQAQVVVQEPMAGYGEALVTGQADEITDDAATAFLLRGETRVIDVFFYAPEQSSGTTFTLTPETPEAGTGTLHLLMVRCPAGVNPHDDPGACTEPLAAGPDAGVTFPESGERVPLGDFERDTTGAYLITGVQTSVTLDGISPPTGSRLATDADQIDGGEISYTVVPGETRDGRMYYYDNQ